MCRGNYILYIIFIYSVTKLEEEQKNKFGFILTMIFTALFVIFFIVTLKNYRSNCYDEVLVEWSIVDYVEESKLELSSEIKVVPT